MKLKKRVKIILIILVTILTIALLTFLACKLFFKKTAVKEAKVLNTIDEYGYVLKDNKSELYKKLFDDLTKILSKKEVDEEAYASKLAELFVADFYSLSEKTSKTDIGGVEIVHPDILSNFLENAENTYYKYVESNIYNNRKQKLPTVENVTVDGVEQEPFSYNEQIDEEAYIVTISWEYSDEEFSDYQDEAKLVFVHNDKKLYLVELK